MGTALYRVITQWVVVISYRYFRTTNGPNFRDQESKIYIMCTAFYSCAHKCSGRFSGCFPNSCYMTTSFRLNCGYLLSTFAATILIYNLCLIVLKIVGARERLVLLLIRFLNIYEFQNISRCYAMVIPSILSLPKLQKYYIGICTY